jgi:hypothetical protein
MLRRVVCLLGEVDGEEWRSLAGDTDVDRVRGGAVRRERMDAQLM